MAYDAAKQILAARDLGRDPAAERKERIAAAKRDMSETLSTLIPLYLSKRTGLRSHKELGRLFTVDKPVRQIERRDIVSMCDKVEARHGMASCRKAFSTVRSFFSWCQSRDVIATNPATGISLPAGTARDRTLTDDEIRLVWRAASKLPLVYGTYVKTLLLLGQRRIETATMRWQDLDLAKREWLIPKEFMKGGAREHLVPLPAYVCEMIGRLPKVNR
jgi:integrase